MDTITRTAAGLAIGLALAAPVAATVRGSCTYDGHRLALEDGAAWIVPPDEDFEPAAVRVIVSMRSSAVVSR